MFRTEPIQARATKLIKNGITNYSDILLIFPLSGLVRIACMKTINIMLALIPITEKLRFI